MQDYITQNYIQKPAYLIAEELGVTTTRVQRLMRKMGLDRREYKRNYMRENYGKLSVDEIASHFGCDRTCVWAAAKTLNIKSFTPLEKNVDFFKSWSSNMAYILGFTIADGYISSLNSKRGMSLVYNINTKDVSILEYIRDNISPYSEVRSSQRYDKRTDKYYNKSVLCIASKEIVLSLYDLGLESPKTGYEVLPDIPNEFKYDFLCGYHDGDGYLRRCTKNGYYFEFTCVNEKFLQDVNSKICNDIGKVQADRGWYKLLIRTKSICKELDSFMTQNRDFYLKRKHFI